MTDATEFQASENPSHGHCSAIRKLVEQHFDLNISQDGERRMREHLPSCDRCKAYYERHLQLSAMDPKAPQPMQRLAVGLGMRPRWHAVPIRTMGFSVSLAAAAIALFFLIPGTQPTSRVAVNTGAQVDDGFAARGPADMVTAALAVFEIGVGDKARALDTENKIASNSELAFAYRNQNKGKRLMVFAVDSQGAVHWYFPAWTDAKNNPTAIPIQHGAALNKLPDAVRHPLAPGKLRVFGLFTDKELNVRQVEASLGPAGLDRAKLGLSDSDVVQSHDLEVAPQ